jgi:hypothetical protein
MVVLSTTFTLTGCEGSELASAGDPKQQCRELLVLWCSRTVDCVVGTESLATENAASALTGCEESGILHLDTQALEPAFTTQPPVDAWGGGTDCDFATGVTANYAACLGEVRVAACGAGSLEPLVPTDCGQVIEVPL